jgi:hypothetical protein
MSSLNVSAKSRGTGLLSPRAGELGYPAPNLGFPSESSSRDDFSRRRELLERFFEV